MCKRDFVGGAPGFDNAAAQVNYILDLLNHLISGDSLEQFVRSGDLSSLAWASVCAGVEWCRVDTNFPGATVPLFCGIYCSLPPPLSSAFDLAALRCAAGMKQSLRLVVKALDSSEVLDSSPSNVSSLPQAQRVHHRLIHRPHFRQH
ncbi:unnamed protein product [Mesocestoides corti]|uniref:Uncharacterized protein n=1 Tax=Mesocestoides corti TaxID=53468 RepID=A0A0R3U2I6_MESCO|nr:unnamed protein product [Mesocestoides corti]